MKKYCSFLLLIILQISKTKSESDRLTQVTIFSETGFSGSSQLINLTECSSLLSFTNTFGLVNSVNTHGNCVNFYDAEDCSGDFIAVKPGNPLHDQLDEWTGFNERIRGIGQCHKDCHETKVETTNVPTNFTAFQKFHYGGHSETIIVSQGTCLPITTLAAAVMSFKVNSKVCIELHEFVNCTGNFRDFPVGSPKHMDLRHWGDWNKPDPVMSVSFCGYRCKNGSDAASSSSTSFTELKSTTVRPNEKTTKKTSDEAASSTAIIALGDKRVINESLTDTHSPFSQKIPDNNSSSESSTWIILLAVLSILATCVIIVGVVLRQRLSNSEDKVIFLNDL